VDGAGRDIDDQLTKSLALRDDLRFLTERGDRLADRLDHLVRSARPLAPDRPVRAVEADVSEGGSQVERNLLQALRLAR
jgi:hypothetical protein